jgi:hypothetical protein
MLNIFLWLNYSKSHRLSLTEIALQVADLLEEGVHPPSPDRRGCKGCFFHDKAKNNRDKMRYSNLSNNMMISKLWTTITIQIQYVDGRVAHMTDTTLHHSLQSSPPTTSWWIDPCIIYTWRCISFGGIKACFPPLNFQVTIHIFRWLFKILVSWMAGWLIPCSNAVE